MLARVILALIKFRRLSRRSYTYRFVAWLRYVWRERLTLPGKFVVAAAVTTGIAGSFPEVMAGSLMFSGFVSLLLLSLAAAYFRRLRVSVTHTLPDRCVAGATIPLRIAVRNQGRRDLFDVGGYEYRLPEELALGGEVRYVARLPRGEMTEFEYPLRAPRRGSYSLRGPTAVSAFPFGLMHAKRFAPSPRRLIVYPAFHPLARLDIPVGQRYQPGGIVLTSHVGESMEFIGSREYRPGDRLRDLHPRSWARVGYPVVKQFQEEFLTRIAMVVDTHSPPPAGLPPARGETRAARLKYRLRQVWGSAPDPGDPVLEANLSLAAAVADHLARQEYVVDLFAAGPELYHFQAGRSLAYLDNILDILACLGRCPRDPFEVIGPQFREALSQTSTVIALLLDWDRPRQEFIRAVLAAGVEAKVVIVSDKFSASELPGPGGAIRVIRPDEVERGVESL